MSQKITPQAAQQLLQAIEQDARLAQELKILLQEEKSLLEQRQYTAQSE